MKKSNLIVLSIFICFLLSLNVQAQLNSFTLSPSGTTTDFMKYVPKGITYNGTNYVTGYLTLAAYMNVSTQQTTDPGIPVQKLQLQGGNILLCRTSYAPGTPDLNPTSRNGAILFSDMVTTSNDWIHGKWGIEYDDQYSSGGLNIFKPISSLTASRVNFNLFIRNDGNVGIGTSEPMAKLQIADGDIFIQDINKGIIMKSPDGNCWRGTLNNSGQLEFEKLADCETLITKTNENNTISQQQVILYPNPGKDYITIQSEVVLNGAEFKMYDSKGSILLQTRITSTLEQIDVKALHDGTYTWQIILNGKNIQNGKWIKQ